MQFAMSARLARPVAIVRQRMAAGRAGAAAPSAKALGAAGEIPRVVSAPGAAAGAAARGIASFRDAAARILVNNALDSIAAQGGPPPLGASSAGEPPLDAETEYDALTWKSIVVRRRGAILFFRGGWGCCRGQG
jgi:hypothetical protein